MNWPHEQALTFLCSRLKEAHLPLPGAPIPFLFSVWDRDNKRMKIIKWQVNIKKQISTSCTRVSFCQFHCLYDSYGRKFACRNTGLAS
jgi:hypothetical protein